MSLMLRLVGVDAWGAKVAGAGCVRHFSATHSEMHSAAVCCTFHDGWRHVFGALSISATAA
jgi:hypothetical protein